MLRSFALSLSLLAAVASTTACAAETTDATNATSEHVGRTSQAIVDGESDDTAAVVSIGDPKAPSCSGTVIGPRLVVTAAHCVTGTEITVNVEDRSIAVAFARVHPEFDEQTMAHDIALLILAENADVAPLPVAAMVPAEGERVRFVGFGRIKAEGDTKGRRAGYVKVDAIDAQQYKTVPDPSTACGRDSGGAVLDESGTRLIGVISSGDTKCQKYAFATRMDVHQVFIDRTMDDLSSRGCSAAFAPVSASSAQNFFFGLALVAIGRRIVSRAHRAESQRKPS